MRWDLRSDTLTLPTRDMREAMANAAVGDDCYGEDPTVARLEATIAEELGMETGLFVPSGTMANLIAIKLQTAPGDLVLVENGAHVVNDEAGAAALISNILFAQTDVLGQMTEADIRRLAPTNPPYYQAPARLLILENTHNRAGGVPKSLPELRPLTETAHELGLACHCDGARLINAAVATGASLASLAAPFDTVSFCLSKGLGAPVGSILAMPARHRLGAMRYRRALGGAMRQSGVLAAAALCGLQGWERRVQRDHAVAKRIAESLRHQTGLRVNSPLSNMIVVDVDDAAARCVALASLGVGASPLSAKRIRLVVHSGVPDDAASEVSAAFEKTQPKG